MPSRNLLDLSCATVNAIVASPKVVMYNVGITMNADRRRRQYALHSAPRPWYHMAFLAYGLTLQQALKLEEGLFQYCAKAAPNTLRARKYSPVKESSYRRSSGGRLDAGEAIYSVYVAWCDPCEDQGGSA